MSKMRTPAMEKIEKKNAKRKKPVKSTPMHESWKRFKRNPTALIGLVCSLYSDSCCNLCTADCSV